MNKIKQKWDGILLKFYKFITFSSIFYYWNPSKQEFIQYFICGRIYQIEWFNFRAEMRFHIIASVSISMWMTKKAGSSIFQIFFYYVENLVINNIFGFMKWSSIKDMLIFFEFNPILLSIEYISFANFVT